MKLGIILETKDKEKEWNTMRFSVTAKKIGGEIKVYLTGEAVEIETPDHEKLDVFAQVEEFDVGGATVLACDRCRIA